MEWHQISGFYNVAKLGSFTKASEAVFRTQPALTQQIKSLEEELGCQLFERIGKRKLLLTPAGERLLVFSETVLTKYEGLVEDLNELKGIQKGRLRIAAPYTTLYNLLPEVLELYTQRFPLVELSLFDRSHANIIELVKNGDVDFGITLESLVSNNFSKIQWKQVESVLLTPKGHPLTRAKHVTVEEIAEYPLILPPKSNAYSSRNKLEALFRAQNIHFRVIMESSNVELSSLYVEMGLGVSYATVDRDCLPKFKDRKLEFIPLAHYFEPEHIVVIFRKDREEKPYKRAFLNIISNSIETRYSL
ncbi:MAG: LysR substrate-binding domain-containing protein [Dehalococcoidia bacterium]